MAARKEQRARCPTCDEWYDPRSERAKVHEHPEPQSGPPLDAWQSSRLPYERWVQETPEGRAWLEWRKHRANTGARNG